MSTLITVILIIIVGVGLGVLYDFKRRVRGKEKQLAEAIVQTEIKFDDTPLKPKRKPRAPYKSPGSRGPGNASVKIKDAAYYDPILAEFQHPDHPTLRDIASKYNVSHATVIRVRDGEHWSRKAKYRKHLNTPGVAK